MSKNSVTSIGGVALSVGTSKVGAELAGAQMPKVDTLLKLIAYQQQHPHAGDAEIAEGIGISSRHVRRCKKEVNLLKHQLAESALQPGQIQFLLSLLNQWAPDQQEIAQHFQKQIGISYTGSLRIKHPDEWTPLSWLEIGELTDIEMGSLDQPDPMLFSWLQFLCYDPLLMSYQNGEIEERLAISCEAVNGHSEWRLTLREDLRWSDGKPITFEEVIEAFSASRIAPIITEIKPDGKTQLRIRLSQAEALFPFWLRYICPLPSHSAPTLLCDFWCLSIKAFPSRYHDPLLRAQPGLLSWRGYLYRLVDRETFYTTRQRH